MCSQNLYAIKVASRMMNVPPPRPVAMAIVLTHALIHRLVLAAPNVWPNSTEQYVPVPREPRVIRSSIVINHVSRIQ